MQNFLNSHTSSYTITLNPHSLHTEPTMSTVWSEAHLNGHFYCKICPFNAWALLYVASGGRDRDTSQIAKFMGPTWGPPGSCQPQMGPMSAPWTLLSGISRGILTLQSKYNRNLIFLSSYNHVYIDKHNSAFHKHIFRAIKWKYFYILIITQQSTIKQCVHLLACINWFVQERHNSIAIMHCNYVFFALTHRNVVLLYLWATMDNQLMEITDQLSSRKPAT